MFYAPLEIASLKKKKKKMADLQFIIPDRMSPVTPPNLNGQTIPLIDA
jgi:hypothetical protein